MPFFTRMQRFLRRINRSNNVRRRDEQAMIEQAMIEQAVIDELKEKLKSQNCQQKND